MTDNQTHTKAQCPTYNPDDVRKLAKWILDDGTIRIDDGGSLASHGLMYCEDCDQYEDKTGNIKHTQLHNQNCH